MQTLHVNYNDQSVTASIVAPVVTASYNARRYLFWQEDNGD